MDCHKHDYKRNHRLLHALGLADEVMVADRDLVVGDWVLLPVSGSRDNDRLHIQTVTVDGPRNVLVTVREPDGNSTQWRVDGAWICRRSLVPQEPPTPNGQHARTRLSENWAGTKCRVHTIKASVTVRWADGPSYHSVVGLLHAAGGQRIRSERKLSPWLLAAAVIRATIFPALVGAGCVELVARAIATQSVSVFTAGPPRARGDRGGPRRAVGDGGTPERRASPCREQRVLQAFGSRGIAVPLGSWRPEGACAVVTAPRRASTS